MNTRETELKPEGTCRVPMWMGGLPAGHCGEPAWGEYIPGPTFKDAWTGEVRRLDGKYHGYVSGLACPKHGGPEPGAPRVLQDGYSDQGRPMYFAFYPDFINLQESPAAFSTKPWVAVEKLLKEYPRGDQQ